MTKAEQFRAQAALIRKAASTRTEGGHKTNQMLRELAEKLERRAEKLEPQTINEQRRQRGLKPLEGLTENAKVSHET